MARFNLSSRAMISTACVLGDLAGWFDRELSHVPLPELREVAGMVARNLGAFVRFPQRAQLLWAGCSRVAIPPAKLRYHAYPASIKDAARCTGIRLDRRPNGPAIASYLLARGDRPPRLGSSNSWSVHHIYSGKFPCGAGRETLHAAKHDLHFTQSAGLVAVHPVADALCDELPCFAWLLRGMAFERFRYDPDSAFGAATNEFGFSDGVAPAVLHRTA